VAKHTGFVDLATDTWYFPSLSFNLPESDLHRDRGSASVAARAWIAAERLRLDALEAEVPDAPLRPGAVPWEAATTAPGARAWTAGELAELTRATGALVDGVRELLGVAGVPNG